MKFLRPLLLFLAVMAGSAEPLRALDWPRFLEQHDPIWEQFPPSWNTGGFTGNGQLALMIYLTAADNRVDFHLGRADVTDHRKAPDRKTSFGVPGTSLQYDYSRLDLGRMALRPAGRIRSGTMRLDLWNAEVRGTLRTDLGEINFRAYTHRDEMLDVVDVTSTEKTADGQTAPWKWDFLPAPARAPRSITNPSEEGAKTYTPNPAARLAPADGASVCVQELLAGGDYATAWRESRPGPDRGTLFLSTANEVPAAGQSARVAAQCVERASRQKPDELIASHRAWWHDFYPHSFLSVPDGKLESFYWIQLYKFASASRQDGPIIDCTGPFFRVTQWPGVWWNLNVQLTYWLPLASNHLDLDEPLIHELDRTFDAQLRNACQAAGIGNLAWVLHNYWWHYRFAGDPAAIREKWAPKAAQLAECYLQRLVREGDGKLHLPQTESPEYPGRPGTKGFGHFDDSNYNLALLRWLLHSLLAATDPQAPQTAAWKQTLADLTPLVTGPDGLMIGRDQPLAISHRHYSHLLALYPLFQLDPDLPADRELVDRSVTHWHQVENGKLLRGYSFTGAASLYAALGRGDDALAMLRIFLTGGTERANVTQNTFYFETGGRNPVIETPLSGATALSQMLLQSWGGKLRVFPAVPQAWGEAAFKDLRGEGGFLVSAHREAGKTVWVAVKSLTGQPCRLKVADWSDAPTLESTSLGRVQAVAPGEFVLDLKSGGQALVSPTEAGLHAVVEPMPHPPEERNRYGVKAGRPCSHRSILARTPPRPLKTNIILLAAFLAAAAPAAAGENFYVSPTGGDGNDGSRAAPFATVDRAREAVRAALTRPGGSLPGGATVWIAGGDYELHESLEMTAADSGRAGAPVVYRASGNGVPRLLGNVAVNPALWKPLGEAARKRVHPKVDPAALRELDLAGLGLTRTRQFAPGNHFTDQWFTIDLFANGQRQPLSHWPNPAENIRDVNDPGWTTCNGSKSTDAFFFGAGGQPDDKDATDELDLDGTHRAERWKSSLAAGHEIWLKGFWRTPWSPVTMKVAEIDPAAQWIRLAEAPPEGMGSKYTRAVGTAPAWRVGSGQEKWLALNLLDEIDQPGEWALDAADRKLYWYPPAPVNTLEVRISDRDTPLVRLDGANFIQLIGLTLEGGMGTGIEIVNGQDDTVAGCTLRNVDGTGIRLQGGARNTVQSCDIVEGGGGGIEVVQAGDRAKLVSADTRLLNNHIHHLGRLAFREGILMEDAVGVTVAHNLLHDLPKGALRTDRVNNCLFEANEVHNDALGESDTGAFYNYGGWTTYGNVFRGNLVHHCNRSNGFYSDDGTSGDIYQENVAYDVIDGLLFGGGHDLIARHNLFVKTKAQSMDDRGIARHYQLGTAYEARLRAMRPDEEPWKSYGQRLKAEFGLTENLWADVLDPAKHPEYPNGSTMVDNVAVATGGFLKPKHGDVDVRDNVLIPTMEAAGFRDLARMDLRSDRPEILAKFPRLDTVLAQAGLQPDEYRPRVPSREETGGFTDHGREGDLRNEDQFIKRSQ